MISRHSDRNKLVIGKLRVGPRLLYNGLGTQLEFFGRGPTPYRIIARGQVIGRFVNFREAQRCFYVLWHALKALKDGKRVLDDMRAAL